MASGLVAGRLALVTGAGSGLGRAACQVLSREGATVIAADKNYAAAAETIKTHTALASGSNAAEHSAVELDVSDSSAVQKLVQTTLKQYKSPPTIIANSAGITRDNWLLKMSEDDFTLVQNVNLRVRLQGTFLVMQAFAKAKTEASLSLAMLNNGTFLVMQAFAKAMTEASLPGSIINISSIVGKYGNIGQTNYAGSKAGVVAMSQSAAKELGKFNIRVNVILPGFINTPMIQTVPEKVLTGMLKLVPLGRLGDPMEVAELIAFLSSDKSSFISGASIDITGGY